MSATMPDVEQWSAGNDGCGKWAIYVGNETLKGWSGKGKILVSGLREIDARKLVTAHELSTAQAREPLVAALEFYADSPRNNDGGYRARAALTGTEGK